MRSPLTMRAPCMALGASLALAACGGDEQAADTSGLDASTGPAPLDAGSHTMAVTLRFKGKVGSEDLACGQRYAGLGSSQIPGTVRDFRFFVHDVRLIDARGAEVAVQLDDRPPFQSSDVALLDFTDGRAGCTSGAPESNVVLHGTVPAATYTGIAFTTGVPPALNHADPVLAPAPLMAPSVHWTWRQGYRFVIAELDVDEGVAAQPDAGATPSGEEAAGKPGLVYAHIGSVGCSGNLGAYACTRANRSRITLTGFDPAKSTVLADLSALFASSDLRGVVQCHSDDPACAPALSALGVDPASGEPVSGQRVFRSE